MAVGTRGAAMAPHILTYQLTLISTRAGEGRIMPNKFLFVPHTSRISRPSYSPATEMMLINNVRMLIEMQWGMLTGFQNTLFFNALSFHTTPSLAEQRFCYTSHVCNSQWDLDISEYAFQFL